VSATARLAAEAVGAFFLVYAIVASNLATASTDPILALFIAAVMTGAVLAAAIAATQPVSGAHLNPAVSAALWLEGRLSSALLGPYVLAQVGGAVGGAVAANAVFGTDVLTIGDVEREGAGMIGGEFVVTIGLVGLIVMLIRLERAGWVAASVGAYVAAGHFLSPSTGFANPAVTVARVFADGPGGIAPEGALGFISVQVGAGLVVGLAARAWRSRPANHG